MESQPNMSESRATESSNQAIWNFVDKLYSTNCKTLKEDRWFERHYASALRLFLGQWTVSEGADEIHPRILTSLADYLAAPMAKLFNNSLETGIIPAEWKSSSICPIHKEGSKNDVANYRPICLTSVACKILEKILKENILQYLKKVPF